MTKPVDYRLLVPGFGSWRIVYSVPKQMWELSYSVRTGGEQWVLCQEYSHPETAAAAVSERRTGARIWDSLRYASPALSDSLRTWITDASEGVQEDSPD